MKEPCSACLILNNLVKEIIAKLQKKFDNLDIQYVEFSNLARIHEIEGLEVEKFPAIIVNGEQVTAGELPDIN
ncbi:MAG: thioredoxin family protein, partial [Tepidanaerobacteraceae bacterium]